MNPLISVIIPTYNRSSLIMQTLESVFIQSFKNIEVIVVDDGSSDNTADIILKNYKSQVLILTLQHSGLPAVARNAGIEAAKGDFIAFCDSDDIWMENKLEIQMQELINSNFNFSCSNALVLGTSKLYELPDQFRYKDLNKELVWNNFVINSSVLLRRDIIGQNRFVIKEFFRGYEDYLLWLTLAPKLKISYHDQPLLYYRTHTANISKEQKLNDTKVQLQILLADKNYFYYPIVRLKKFLRYLYKLLK